MAETQGENDINIESMLVSFIIPSYNSVHTVKRCLDSIYVRIIFPFTIVYFKYFM